MPMSTSQATTTPFGPRRYNVTLLLALSIGFWGATAPERLPAAETQPAVDQASLGAGNARALAVAHASPLVMSAYHQIQDNARSLHDPKIRKETLDLVANEKVCVSSRAHLGAAEKERILSALREAKLIDPADEAAFPGGLLAGVFPPLVDETSDCPQLPQPFLSAPGSYWGGHHSEPGGLMVHEAFNDFSDLALERNYQQIYGTKRPDGFPVVGARVPLGAHPGDLPIDSDLILAVPLWHDWAKSYVFQWTAEGREFQELNFGGDGKSDDYGSAGSSKTGAHHILGIAEAMKRQMPPEFVIMQASAHSAPTSGNEYKVVNWLRTAALLASIDPIKAGYLVEVDHRLRLPALRAIHNEDFPAGMAHTNMLVEYLAHNLSDADYTFTIPVVHDVEALLAKLAPEYGYDPGEPTRYNWQFRNPVLSTLSSERLYILYSSQGMAGVKTELDLLRRRGMI